MPAIEPDLPAHVVVASPAPAKKWAQRFRRALLAFGLAAVLSVESVAQSTHPPFALRKQAFAAGTVAHADQLRLTGTLGEPAVAVLSGGTFRLTAGFHTPRRGLREASIFSNGFEDSP